MTPQELLAKKVKSKRDELRDGLLTYANEMEADFEELLSDLADAAYQQGYDDGVNDCNKDERPNE